MNEVEIVVTSKDRTDFAKIGEKAQTQLRNSTRKGLDDVEKITDEKFKEIGDKAGADMGERLRESSRPAFTEAGRDAGQKFGEEFKRDVNGRLRDARGRFVSEGRQIGEGLSAGVGKGITGLGRDVEKGFSLASRAGSAFGKGMDLLGQQAQKLDGMWRLLPSAIITGLQLLPAAAAAAGGAITLALGGALAAIGIKAQMGAADVQKAFAGMRAHVVDETKKISTPFHDTLLHVAGDARRAFDSLEPSLAGAFAKIAPALTRFSGQASASLSKLNPAINSIGTAFDRVLSSLGGRMGPIMNNFGTGIKAITDAVAANPGSFTGFVEGISKITRYTGDGLGILIRYAGQFKTFFETLNAFALGPIADLALGFGKLNGLIGQTGDKFAVGGGEFQSFAEQAASGSVKLSALDKDMKTLASDAASAADKANALSDAFSRLLNPAEAVFKDTANLKESMIALGKALKDSHGKINDTTAAARASKQAFGGMIDNAKTLASDMLNSGKSIGQVRAALQPTIAQMYAFAGSNQKARALVDQFVQSLDGMPEKKSVGLSLDARQFFTALHQAKGVKIDPKTGLLKGNNSDYLNKWLRTNHLRINPKTGLLKGNNADYYNKWLRANHLRIDPKTGVIKGNSSAFWSAVHAIPQVVGHRQISVTYVPTNSANEPGHTRRAHGGIVGHAAEGGLRSNLTLVGEQGPELVELPGGSRVRSNPDTRAALAGGAGGGEQRIVIEWAGGNAGDEFIQWLRKNIRIRSGGGTNSVQKALGGT